VTPSFDYAGPVYVEPFLGAGATWLALLDPDLVALVSWMGGKRKFARRILNLLGLDPGFPIASLLGDACWWGWVWAVVLDPVLGPQVCAILRSWRGEDPRALWFRLRDLGPVTDDVATAAAQLLWLQARAASGVPVWWEGGGTWVLTEEGWRYVEGAGASVRMVAMSGRGDLQKPGCKDQATAGGGARSGPWMEVADVLDAEAVRGDAGERRRGERGAAGSPGSACAMGGSPREWG
jgi:hypothetical protein